MSEWADAFHLEIHPDKFIFYTNDVHAELPVYKGQAIQPEENHQLYTVGFVLA